LTSDPSRLKRGDRNNRGSGTRVSREDGEGGRGTGLFDILVGETSGEPRDASERLGNGDDLGAVNQLALVLAEERELGHNITEAVGQFDRVNDEGLPLASGPGVTSEIVVGLKTNFTPERDSTSP